MVLSPVIEEGEDATPVWALPCHALMMSVHSRVFAASARHSDKLTPELTEDGKRVMRLPLSERAARKLLQLFYGCKWHADDWDLTEACQLAMLGHMKDIEGDH